MQDTDTHSLLWFHSMKLVYISHLHTEGRGEINLQAVAFFFFFFSLAFIGMYYSVANENLGFVDFFIFKGANSALETSQSPATVQMSLSIIQND